MTMQARESAFANDLVVVVLDDSGPRPWMRLAAPLVYWSAHLGYTIQVPAGFEFDGASIPQAAMSMTGWPGLRAACIHDWLVDQPQIPRYDADAVFREALAVCGVPDQVAALMWAAVALRTARLANYSDEERPGA